MTRPPTTLTTITFCPTCNGKGELEVAPEHCTRRDKPAWYRCPDCQGTGIITTEEDDGGTSA